jgi:phage terminase large subunit
MPFQPITTTRKLAKMRKRLRFVSGGTSAGKTISIEQLLMDDAMTDTSPTLTSIVSQSFPHLRKGAIRDFQTIMMEQGYWEDRRWSKTEWTYTFPLVDVKGNNRIIGDTGSQIEFFSGDQSDKVRGPRRDRLFVNEGNTLAPETFRQLLLRTRQYAWMDWNPVSEFYAYTDYIGQRDDLDFIKVTYLDNEALDEATISEIEQLKRNKFAWQVYGLGELGEAEGRIYKGWQVVEEIPHEARLERRGLDFGFTNDPAVLIDIYYYNGGYILDEQLYRKGMHNKDIADLINNLDEPGTLVIADSAEPKSIDEIKSYGVNILGAEKGQGSVKAGIDFVQGQKISYTRRSVNLGKSYNNYVWQTDKDGNIINVPDHFWSDGMDAVRYGFDGLRPNEGAGQLYVDPWILQQSNQWSNV